MEIFSKKKKILIAKLFFLKNLKKKRNDICPSNEFIQLSAQVLEKGRILKAHSHLNIQRKSNITQEIWLVFKGKIEASIFDLDKKIITHLFICTHVCGVCYHHTMYIGY